jgi:1-acyl-sn-glycerol-3-phosphate acyltransferase
MAYFIASIAVVGFIFSYVGAIPIYILARFFPKLKSRADRNVMYGVNVLMWTQPWYKPQLNFTKYSEIKKNNPKILFVGNHRSHLDVFVLLTRIPGIRVFANKYIFKVPFLNVMMKYTEQIPVEQNRLDSFIKGLEIVKERIVAGENVFVFPELTRCPVGHRGTQNFSSAPFKAAMDVGAVIVPVVIKNTDRAWPRGKMEISFGSQISFKMLDAIPSSDFSSADELRNQVRIKIDAELGERPIYPLRPREITV